MAKVRVVVLMEPAEVARLDVLANHHQVSRGEEVRQSLRWWADWGFSHGGQPPAPMPPATPPPSEC